MGNIPEEDKWDTLFFFFFVQTDIDVGARLALVVVMALIVALVGVGVLDGIICCAEQRKDRFLEQEETRKKMR